MSQTISAVIIQLLAIFLPMLGITVGSVALTSFVQTAVVILAGVWIWIRRVRQGDVNFAGVRK